MRAPLREDASLVRSAEEDASEGAAGESSEGGLEASAISGQVPPAGPQWLRGLPPLTALGFDMPLCASLDGFTLHARTRAGAHDDKGREALLRYILPPPSPTTASSHAPTASSASCSNALTPTAPSPSTWIR